MNPLLNHMQSPTRQSQQSQPQNMIEAFKQFQAAMQGKDAQAMVYQLVQSGIISQQQYNQIMQQAQPFASMLK